MFSKQFIRKNSLIDVQPKGIRHPIYLRNNTTDLAMFDYIFLAKEMDIDFGFKPKVVVDCGGHIGLCAVFLANKYPDATIYSIEPEESNYEMLLKNTNPYPNIKCLNLGLWNKPSYLKIVDAGFGHWGFITEEVSKKEEATVEAISISKIMELYHIDEIDVCKINIEGTEKEMFEKNYETWIPKTKSIVIELHDRMKEGCTRSFLNAMMHYDFSIYPHGSYLVCSITGKPLPPQNM